MHHTDSEHVGSLQIESFVGVFIDEYCLSYDSECVQVFYEIIVNSFSEADMYFPEKQQYIYLE